MSNFIVEDIKNTFRGKDNALAQLIIINAVIFILVNLVEAFMNFSGSNPSEFLKWLSLPADLSDYITKFWTLFTYMFLHSRFFHVLFNMLWLYWLGRILVEYLGNGKLISTYILGGISGGILYMAIYNIMNVISPGIPSFTMNAHLLGASAGVMAVVFATATLLPNFSIHLFLIGPVRLKYIALGALVITTLLDLADNTGGKIAHMGGALFGFLYIRQLQKGRDLASGFDKFREKTMNTFSSKPKIKVVHKKTKSDTEFRKAKVREQERLDNILDKISQSGYESLTEEEKSFLFKVSNDK